MNQFQLSGAKRVRIEVTTMDDVTYELELQGPDSTANLKVEHHTSTGPDASGLGMETTPTGCATVKLEAFGKLAKSERRQAS